MAYAGFWKRAAAHIFDGFIYGSINWLVNFFVGLIFGLIIGFPAMEDPSLGVSLASLLLSFCTATIVWAAYYAWPESSSWQATIGKRIFGLRVTDTHGQRISFWRAVWRNFAKIFSAIILCIGYLMCIWTEKKQCLHDMMADCVVVDEAPGTKTGCVVAVLVTYVLAGAFIVILCVGIIAAIAIPQFAKEAENARAKQAVTILKTTSQAQQRYYLQNGIYARTWDKLDVAPGECASAQNATCTTEHFTLELKSKGISATRTGGDAPKYRIFESYDWENENPVTCEPLTPNAQSVCDSLK